MTPFDEDEADALANATDYGLIAGDLDPNVNTAHWLARELRVGQVYVNTYGAGGGVELPFGGYKRSGYGREKGFEALLRVHAGQERGAEVHEAVVPSAPSARSAAMRSPS